MMCIIVYICAARTVDVYVEAAFHAEECAECMSNRLRVNAVDKRYCRCRHSILNVHPSRNPHAAVLDDSVRVLDVEGEIAALVLAQVVGIEVRTRVVVGIAHYLGLRVVRGDVQTEFGDDRAADLSGECLECLVDVLEVAVDVQMVGVHSRDDGNLREQLEERTVELVGLGDYRRVVADKQIGVIILGYAAEECRTSDLAVGEYVREQRAGCGLSVRSGNGEAALSLGDFTERLRSLEQRVAVLLHIDKFLEVVRNCRGVDNQGVLDVLRDEVRVVLVMDSDALDNEFFGQF